MLFAVLAAALASPIVVVSSADPPAVTCPMIDAASAGAPAACGDEKASRSLVVQGAEASRRIGPITADVSEPSRIRLDTVALYGPEGQRPVTISVETTPERAAADLVILREVASKVEAYPTWRAREY